MRSLGMGVTIVRNTISINQLEKLINKKFEKLALVLSPGPGTPSGAGNLLSIANHFQGFLPTIGICLGHQAIIKSLGGEIGKTKEVIHGKSSLMKIPNHRLFYDLKEVEAVGRYHSLMGHSLPPTIEVLAEIDQIPMVILCEEKKVIGFQFHPESILTLNGKIFLNNAINFF